MQLIQAARKNIGSLLEQCNVPYKTFPFDEDLYNACVDDAARHGYPVNGNQSVLAFLQEGVFYAANSLAHLPRPIQVWTALYTSCGIYIDEVPNIFPEEMPDVYLFNDRFIRKEPQRNGVLEAYADITRRASDLYRPIACQLITTSTQNFVTATILEYETKSMKISNAAERYPIYQRTLSGVGEAYAYIVFPWKIPLNEYVQAIPDVTLFIHSVNDVFSFYKEELVGETTNQVSTLAARANKSKLEALRELTETTIGLYKTIVKILEDSPAANEAFKRYAVGYFYFHTSTPRYRVKELGL